MFFFKYYGDHRDQHVLTHSSPTRRSSDLPATGLARINAGLSRATPVSTGSAQLLDQRDQILEQMSALSDISVTMDVAGRATVKLGSASGPVFVTPGVDPGKILYSRNVDGAVSYGLRRNGVPQSVSPDRKRGR